LDADEFRMLRRTKAEVLPDLPPKRYVDVEVELSKEQKAQYFGAQLVYEEQLRAGDESGAMTFALRSRQLATCSWDADWTPVVGGVSAKRDWLFEWLSERGFIEFDAMSDVDAKVVVVSQFSKVLWWLRAELALVGVRAEVLDGSVSGAKRASIQDEFQNGLLRVVLLSGSMGVGINLDKADDLILLDVPYDPDRVEQIEDRVHRASSNHHVSIWNVAAVDTIDQVILEQVSKRYRITRELLDGSRGVEFARKVMAIVRKGNVDGAE
jgi:SNF2 family DNA or RNA helicase